MPEKFLEIPNEKKLTRQIMFEHGSEQKFNATY